MADIVVITGGDADIPQGLYIDGELKFGEYQASVDEICNAAGIGCHSVSIPLLELSPEDTVVAEQIMSAESVDEILSLLHANPAVHSGSYVPSDADGNFLYIDVWEGEKTLFAPDGRRLDRSLEFMLMQEVLDAAGIEHTVQSAHGSVSELPDRLSDLRLDDEDSCDIEDADAE